MTSAGDAMVPLEAPPGRKIPPAIWALAVFVALLHCWPYLVASLTPPPGWHFTGNLSPSPDFAQYRVWVRQSQVEGPIVSDQFTTEPNRKFLPVFFYYGVGKLARATGWSPEMIVAWLGAPLALLLVLVMYEAVRRFLPAGSARGWALGVMLFGGGLGAYLKDLRDLGYATGNGILRRLVVTPLSDWSVLEDLRGQYPVTTLFDSHFLIVWILATAAVLAFHSAVERPSPWRVSKAAMLFAAATLAHIYEAITLMAIAAAVTALLWRKGFPVRSALISLVACSAAATVTLGGLALLQRASGIPMPDWRANAMLLSIFLLGFPLQVALGLSGLPRLWRDGGRNEVFLIGWAAGCIALTFAAPFYPWPDRGTMTLAVPLAVITAAVYFRDHVRVRPWHAVVALVLVGYTPIQVTTHLWARTRFRPDAAYRFLGPEHDKILAALRAHAGRNDILVARKADVHWLAPDFPGRHYAGHFFLTVDYERKRQRLEAFYQDPGGQAAFLTEAGATLVYVAAEDHPDRFVAIPGLRPVVETGVGTLFSFTSAGPASSNEPVPPAPRTGTREPDRTERPEP